MKHNGFTLVELMVVIVIIGILAAVAIPRFQQASNKAKASELPTAMNSIMTAQSVYKGEKSEYANCPATDVNGDHANDLIESTLGLRLQGSYFDYYTVPTVESFSVGAVVWKSFGGISAGTEVVVTEFMTFTYPAGDFEKLKKLSVYLK